MITQEAREAADRLCSSNTCFDCRDELEKAIAEAEQRGRERAAVIAERYQEEAGGSESYKSACSHIAAAIRNAKEA